MHLAFFAQLGAKYDMERCSHGNNTIHFSTLTSIFIKARTYQFFITSFDIHLAGEISKFLALVLRSPDVLSDNLRNKDSYPWHSLRHFVNTASLSYAKRSQHTFLTS